MTNHHVGRRAVLVALVVALAVAGAVVFSVRSRDGASPPDARRQPTASPTRASPTATCRGASCAHVEPTATVCQNDVVTVFRKRGYGVLVELRYSKRCGAAWAKMTGTSPGDRVQVLVEERETEEYRQQTGGNAHTRMVPVDRPEDARACAIVVDRGTVCAGGSGSPASTGR